MAETGDGWARPSNEYNVLTGRGPTLGHCRQCGAVVHSRGGAACCASCGLPAEEAKGATAPAAKAPEEAYAVAGSQEVGPRRGGRRKE